MDLKALFIERGLVAANQVLPPMPEPLSRARMSMQRRHLAEVAARSAMPVLQIPTDFGPPARLASGDRRELKGRNQGNL
jgi:hypothetical protein